MITIITLSLSIVLPISIFSFTKYFLVNYKVEFKMEVSNNLLLGYYNLVTSHGDAKPLLDLDTIYMFLFDIQLGIHVIIL